MRILICMLISGCSGYCPVDIGDRVKLHGSEKRGIVVSTSSYGSMTPNCRVAVRYDDGSFSKGETNDPTESDNYAYNWKFEVLD
jgi:hypothetical protein